MRKTLMICAAIALASPAIGGQTGHGSGSHGGDHAGMAEGVHAEATINAIEGDTVNVSHGPIPEIGWPAMTMDMKLLEGAETGGVGPGDKAMMMLEKGEDGMYAIRALMPAE